MKAMIDLVIGHFCLGFFIAACFIMPARLFMAMIGPAIGGGSDYLYNTIPIVRSNALDGEC